MTFQYPKTVAAALKSDHSQWAIGDALIGEIKGDRTFEAAAAALAECGIDYKPSSLSAFHLAAKTFKQRNLTYAYGNDRHALTFTVYREAGDPDTLQRIIDRADGKRKITKSFARDALDAFDQEEREAKEKANKAARKEKDEAEKAEQKAREAEQKAADAKAKAEAKQQRAEAKAKKEAAEAKIKETRTAPARQKGKDKKDKDALVIGTMNSKKLYAMIEARESAKRARQTYKAFEAHVDELSDKAIAALTEAALAAMTEWKRVADLIRSRTTNKRGHLRVVNE